MVSYIITHGGENKTRERNLALVLNWLQPFSFDVIVVEQNNVPKVKSLADRMNAKHVFAYNPGVFNKSWAVNIGVKAASDDIILLGDNDIVLRPEAINQTVDTLKSGGDSVNPFTVFVDMTPLQTLIYSKTSHLPVFPLRRRHFASFCSGMVGFTRSCLEDIGGWDERFRGWGAEDDAVSVKLHKFNKRMKVLDNKCYHLYHSRTIYDKNRHENYKNNLQLLKEMEITPNLETLKQDYNKLGNLDKYKDEI